MARNESSSHAWKYLAPLALAALCLAAAPATASPGFGVPAGDPGELWEPPVPPAACQRSLTAHVVALDQVYYWNRLGAFQPQGMIYALERDVVSQSQDQNNCAATKLPLAAGRVQLREDKRPRPLVLRMNVGDCLTIHFRNLLEPNLASLPDDEQPHTRAASIHVMGLQYVTGPTDAGFNVGANPAGGVVLPGGSTTYTYYADEEGTYLMYSGGATVGGDGDGGSISAGLFGAINVEPAGSRWYRSQVTQADLAHAASPSGVDPAYPQIDYTAQYDSTFNPNCYRASAGALPAPIFEMLNASNEIVHSDLTGIITGPPEAGYGFSSYTPIPNIYPTRSEPFREFTIIFHDEIGAVQAFPEFEHPVLSHTLHSVRDAFAINYGAAGAGAEILANRIGVGPMWKCVDCQYEEFFLTSWAVGDPAMVVDVPANRPCTHVEIENHLPCTPAFGPKANKALYPDDPSNVYHSYLNDRVKFRNLHAGSDDHHVFHLHAHQWLYAPESDKSSYKDSQSIGQGSAFTYEIAYGGSGNRNRTPGDSIFHCHLYPHFAQGMWSLWRVHDTLETGTELDDEGKPVHTTVGADVVTTARALPDAEIAVGTPIPAVVPIPSLPMAPVPAPVQLVNGAVSFTAPPVSNPGYPFWIPGETGSRPPQPPLDILDDGGLPRHTIGAGTATEEHTRLSFAKHITSADTHFLDPNGEPVEQVAMAFHEQTGVITPRPIGGSGQFRLNGRQRQMGAPFADPCETTFGSRLRRYKAANVQMDIVLNKAGWHFPQQRLITLWDDVDPTLMGTRPPEPFFFRAKSADCVEFWHTNLVPSEYLLDDFQVRTPTDILGQHIHLVKFDVTASDGSANGFNYEDGTLSPEEVQDVIAATRIFNTCSGTIFGGDPRDNNLPGNDPLGPCPVVESHPYFTPRGIDADCDGVDDWLGAQTTIQRWWADPVKDNAGNDRTLRTIFTHDHFGPSTHQQAGLYAGLIIEKTDVWRHNETGTPFYTRHDGGPTSWQAVIGNDAAQFREFAIEFADFQLAYEPNEIGPQPAGRLQLACPNPDPKIAYADPAKVINPPGRREVGLPYLFAKPDRCPTNDCSTGPLPPCPEAISAQDPGFTSVNYRSEPVGLRVYDPVTQAQTAFPAEAGDLSFVYESRTDRAIPDLNGVSSSWVPYPNLTGGLHPGDPFTPLMRSYEGDRVKIRVLVGAFEEEHNFTIDGMKWLHQPDEPNSGYRASQMMAISEWFDLEVSRQPSLFTSGDTADFLYRPSASNDFQWDGAWGLFRTYYGTADTLVSLASYNPDNKALTPTQDEALFAQADLRSPDAVATSAGTKAATLPKPPGTTYPRVYCPANLPTLKYDIVAVSAIDALPNGALTYNGRDTSVYYEHSADVCTSGATHLQGAGPLTDETAILFVHRSDLDPVSGKLQPWVKVEPLILRASAGDCLEVTLTNEIQNYYDLPGYSSVPMIIENFNSNQVSPSVDVSLHPALVSYDIRQGDGMNVGRNRLVYPFKQTVAPGQSITYYWYAGDITLAGGTPQFRPIEFGSVPLVSADPIKHTQKGAIGALIVEPPGSAWDYDLVRDPSVPGAPEVMTRASANVWTQTTKFREFVTLFQDDINLRYGLPSDYKNGAPAVPNLAVSDDAQETGQDAFNYRTEPIWFRIGTAPDTPMEKRREFPYYDQVTLNSWVCDDPQTPIYIAKQDAAVRWRVVHPGGDAQNHVFEVQGHNWQDEPYTTSSTVIGNNPKSNVVGSRFGVGTGTAFDILFPTAQGPSGGEFDYLYRDYVPWTFDGGLWGIFRIDSAPVPSIAPPEQP